ncbi:putative carboxypeptidase KEX1 precursor [Phakopsora pachyrhizi]|nr:putative carboxypeptidase KEX1 precursor [Phakopsora pachyrhizi]
MTHPSDQSPTTADGLRRRHHDPIQDQRINEIRGRRSNQKHRQDSGSTSTSSLSSTSSSIPNAADFYVHSLPGQPEGSNLVIYSGHLPFSSPDSDSKKEDERAQSKGFFFLNKANHIGNRQILMVWLNGGPGCSSFDGGLMEVGPLRMVLKANGKLREAEAPWNEYANVLFIDQPTGTGYSYGPENEFVGELEESTQNLMNLLVRFFRIFPEYSNMDLYIAGESFAGQYIPYLAKAILESNSISAPLKGIIIGNGWIDSVNQYMAYSDFAFNVGLLKPGTQAAKEVLDEVEKCKVAIESYGVDKAPIHIPACEGILATITDSTIQTINSQKMCLNMYDVRLVDTYPACGMTWPPELSEITPYLSRDDVKRALHAESHTKNWMECNPRVGKRFKAKTSRPSIELFPKLLEKIKVLLFSGDQDLICCHLGTTRMIENLSWTGQKGFGKDSNELQWSVNGSFAGTWRERDNLTYVILANASHMAPYDVPYASQDMLIRFLGIDLLSAAGAGASVSSRVGVQPETLISRIKLNGSKVELPGILSSKLMMKSDPNQLDPSSSNANSEKKIEESYYNLSSVGVFLILVGSVIGLSYLFRRRLRKQRVGDFAGSRVCQRGGWQRGSLRRVDGG